MNASAKLRLPHIRALDGVRGIASVAVVFTHTLAAGDSIPPGRIFALIFHFCRGLALGVDLFFVLSGYLITTLLLLARRHPGYYREFYVKRAFRILPPIYLVVATVTFIWHYPLNGVLAALFFVANFAFAWGVVDIGPFWTLAIEEQFYLLWPTFIRHISPRRMFQVLLVVIAGCELSREVGNLNAHGRIGQRVLHFDGLAWGALIALVAFRWRVPFSPLNYNRLWKRLYRFPLAWATVTGGLAIGLHRIHDMRVTVASSAFALMVLYIITHPNSWLSRGLATRPLTLLGDISYMLYLSHAYWASAIMSLFGDKFPPSTAPSGYFLQAGLCLLISIVWSVLSLYLFERPVGRLRRFFLSRGGPVKELPTFGLNDESSSATEA